MATEFDRHSNPAETIKTIALSLCLGFGGGAYFMASHGALPALSAAAQTAPAAAPGAPSPPK